jgi:hypothetical protein
VFLFLFLVEFALLFSEGEGAFEFGEGVFELFLDCPVCEYLSGLFLFFDDCLLAVRGD